MSLQAIAELVLIIIPSGICTVVYVGVGVVWILKKIKKIFLEKRRKI